MNRNGNASENNHRVASVMKRRRKALKLSQDTVAAALGVTQAQVAKYEQGSSLPPITKLRPILEVLQTNVQDLLGFDDELVTGHNLPAWAITVARDLATLPEDDRKALAKVIESLALVATANLMLTGRPHGAHA